VVKHNLIYFFGHMEQLTPNPQINHLERTLPFAHTASALSPAGAPLPAATFASGSHHTYDPGHDPEVAWYLPDEAAEEF
jgi:hypothetical protein